MTVNSGSSFVKYFDSRENLTLTKKSGEFLTKTKTPNYENLIYQLYKELLDIVVDGFPKRHPAVKHLALITEK